MPRAVCDSAVCQLLCVACVVHKCQERGVTSRQVAIAQDLKPRDLDYEERRVRETSVSEQEVYVNRDSNQPPFPLYESQSIHANTESLYTR